MNPVDFQGFRITLGVAIVEISLEGATTRAAGPFPERSELPHDAPHKVADLTSQVVVVDKLLRGVEEPPGGGDQLTRGALEGLRSGWRGVRGHAAIMAPTGPWAHLCQAPPPCPAGAPMGWKVTSRTPSASRARSTWRPRSESGSTTLRR
jgi:hypothetical protein